MTQQTMTEKMGVTYTLADDGYYYPDLVLPAEKEEKPIGKYGRMRHRYLKNHRRVLFTELLTSGRLTDHLAETDEQATARMDMLTKQMAERRGVTEHLKAADQMAWVGQMNNIRNAAEEIVIDEIVYA
jgi:hypothetical protein